MKTVEQFFAIIGAISTLIAFIGLVEAMLRWLYPDRKEFAGFLLGEKPPKIGKAATNWETNRNQQTGDTFMLFIRKTPNESIVNILKFIHDFVNRHINERAAAHISYWNYGKARVIDKIQFMQGFYSADEYPLKWLVTLTGNFGYIPGWRDKEFTEQNFGHNIIIEITPPQKVEHILIVIKEPRANARWATGDIRIRESRLFGLWKAEIK